MSQQLTPGGNAALPDGPIAIRITSGADIDVAAYRLTAAGKVRGDGDMIFYGQKQSDDGSVQFSGSGRDSLITLDPARQPAVIERIAIAYSAARPTAQLGDIRLSIEVRGEAVITCPLDSAGRSETALILAECYRRNGAWKIRFVAQGYNGGLKPLSEHFGVDIADEPAPATKPAPAPAARPAPRLSLSKITLDKHNPGVSLAKQADYGTIRVNLNWNHTGSAPQKNGGFLSSLFNKNKGVDLDLGAFIRLQNGNRDCVQALGNRFGSLDRPPYVHLSGDDRTGAVADGEWLHINGSRWKDIAEVLVFAFIYDGVPNWDATDGIVTLHVQGQEIETRLTDGNPRHGMCAIARLLNDGGSIRVERINRYFPGHRDMDRAFGWGFQWTAGRK